MDQENSARVYRFGSANSGWVLFLFSVCVPWYMDCFINYSPGIQREEDKITKSLKEAAKKGNREVSIIYAKEIIRSRQAVRKLYTSKAHLNSIQMHMKEQLGKI